VDGHGKHWLFTIAEESFRPGGGERIAIIGPLVVSAGVPNTARYLETVIPPGFQDGKANGHQHPDPRRGSWSPGVSVWKLRTVS
jgi:hypothetical protein